MIFVHAVSESFLLRLETLTSQILTEEHQQERNRKMIITQSLGPLRIRRPLILFCNYETLMIGSRKAYEVFVFRLAPRQTTNHEPHS